MYNTMDLFHREHGVKSAEILRSADDPNNVIVISEFENIDQARKFAQLDDLKKAMMQGGVADEPDVYFLDRAHRRTFS